MPHRSPFGKKGSAACRAPKRAKRKKAAIPGPTDLKRMTRKGRKPLAPSHIPPESWEEGPAAFEEALTECDINLAELE